MREFIISIFRYLGQIRGWTWLDWLSLFCVLGGVVAMITLICKDQSVTRVLNVGGVLVSLGGSAWLATGVLLSNQDQFKLQSEDGQQAGRVLADASGRVALSMGLLVTGVCLQLASVFVG